MTGDSHAQLVHPAKPAYLAQQQPDERQFRHYDAVSLLFVGSRLLIILMLSVWKTRCLQQISELIGEY